MSTMTDRQRLWFAGVLEARMDLKVYPMEGPSKKYLTMEVRIGPVLGSVADRLVDYLGNGWVQRGDYFELRGYAACRGLFQEVWRDITKDTRTTINNAIRFYKAEANA